MGTNDFYGTIHIKQRQTSKEKIIDANVNVITYCEWAIKTHLKFSDCDIAGAIGIAVAQCGETLCTNVHVFMDEGHHTAVLRCKLHS